MTVVWSLCFLFLSPVRLPYNVMWVNRAGYGLLRAKGFPNDSFAKSGPTQEGSFTNYIARDTTL